MMDLTLNANSVIILVMHARHHQIVPVVTIMINVRKVDLPVPVTMATLITV
jgi:hypothetical protein